MEVGLFHTQAEFFASAINTPRPMDKSHALPQVILEAIRANAQEDRKAFHLRRKLALLRAEAMASNLEKEEEKLHAALPSCSWMARVVEGKRILLFS